MEKTNGGNLIQIKNLVATVNLNNGDTLVTVNKANMELKRGNSYAKASLILFDDFRSGKMGRITLECRL